MKKLIVLAMLLVLPLVLAEDEAGVTPDSAMYGLDTGADSLSLAFTFNEEKKAEKSLKIAGERLLEAEEMAKENKTEEMAEAEEQHNKMIEKAEKATDDIDDGDDANGHKDALKKMARLQNRTEEHAQKVAEVKERILERQRERMSEEQIAHMEQVFNRIMVKAAEMEKVADANKEQAKEKLKEKVGDQEAEQAEQEADEETGLKKARDERAAKEITKAENALKEAKQKLKESGASEDDILAAEKLLEQVKAAKQNGDAKEARQMAEKIKDFGNEVSAIAKKLGESKANGDFEQMKEQLRQAIRARYEEHMNELVERAPEQVQEQIRQRVEEQIQKIDDRDNRTKSPSGIGGGNSTKPADKGNSTGRPYDDTNSTKPDDDVRKDTNSTGNSTGKDAESGKGGSQS